MRVYMDNAATTSLDRDVLQQMLPYFSEEFGNASSVHSYGRKARAAIDKARQQVATAINASPAEIYFTSGGTESDNIALKGVAAAYANKGKHIITSAIEHHGVLHSAQYLEKHGYEVDYIQADEDGLIDVEAVKAAVRTDTILISIMFANNEIGTIQPVAEIGAFARGKGILFHTDAVQAVGSIPVDVQAMNIDLLALSAHKFNGPKGVGALYARKGVRFEAQIHGGAQERNKRAGTDNTPGIVGMGYAIEKAVAALEEKSAHLSRLRDNLIDGILTRIPHTRLNGHPTKRLAGNVNVSIEFIEGESLLLSLDMKGIAASSGSACTSGSLDPSHVLLGIGLSHAIAHGSLRLSLGAGNTQEEVDYVLDELVPIVERLREMSPLFAQVKGDAKYV
ncbi:MAG: cysteine desulfurase NifS [Christensenellales bacterium]|jgi:cysteine desulfurase